MMFCQNRDLISKNDPTLASCLHKFVCDDILQRQGRVRGANIAWSGNFENEKFWRVMLAEGTSLKFFGPAGGRSLRARAVLMAENVACGVDSFFVSGIVQAIFLSEGAFAKFWSKRESATW